jgi:hypothetical protein
MKSAIDAPEFIDFLQHRVNSFTKWDLMRFFHDNPHALDTAANIAKYTLRNPRLVERELEELVSVGLVLHEQHPHAQVYRLTPEAEAREQLTRFLAACDDRDFRVWAINRVIHAMHSSPRHDF